MFEFGLPWMFLLLPLPLLVRWLIPPYKQQIEAVQAPFFDELVELSGETPSKGAVIPRRHFLQTLLLPVFWLLLVVALAQPQWVEDPITKIESARDLMLAVDLSGSMDAQDFVDEKGNNVDRLSAAKQVLADFIARRKGDRLGLILFGTQAFLQVPFSQDHDTFSTLLEEAQVRMAGPQTVIGDAIGLAMKLFENSETRNRVMILLTDGNDTGSKVPPARAAGIAAQNGVTIHTVAMGNPETVGEAKLDIEALKEISDVTKGQFFMANNREELESIYQQLDDLEPEEFETLSFRPKKPLFHFPLALFLGLYFTFILVMAIRHLFRPKEKAT